MEIESSPPRILKGHPELKEPLSDHSWMIELQADQLARLHSPRNQL